MQAMHEVDVVQAAVNPVLEPDDGSLDPVTGDVLTQVTTELSRMTSLLGRGSASARRRIAEIQAQVAARLRAIAKLMTSSRIDPWIRLRLSPADALLSPSTNPARVGVFPVSANPLHWGHLLCGLTVMARAGLDKVIYVITSDSCPAEDLFPEEIRRGGAADAIALFQPLFTLVPTSAGKSLGGPSSLFRLLGLNAQQMVEAFYISAGECSPSSSIEELIATLLGGGAAHNERMHSVNLVVINDAGQRPTLENPRTLVVPAPLPAASAAGIRAALRSPQHRDELAFLPAGVFRHFRMLSVFD